ncbi:MAG: helix-hairpin-helix domain-containing protein [candidate division WOR-3 bacterium]|nr:helix-hairpin-helix domain-containing protein [candidate division WOR-3 bacterium]
MNNKEKLVLYFLIISLIIGSGISLNKRQQERQKLGDIEFEIKQIADTGITIKKRGIRTGMIRNRFPVDINHATSKELEVLPGIGPVLAQRIIEERSRVGKFSSPEDLLKVSGIGQKKLAKIRDKIKIEN